ncbi:MAG TPA: cation:dicarboxylase symporter family transporter [Rectinema sp.]|jgi:Na+/H+-dicarboxylate symporter|nr:dicarboxylate/amino acid:cation symporter [Spirochaetia bacterium]HOC27407.1 cation:dicarboxylase symporter family transporter [Rectinema sp.]HPK79210.1 cation:dicarboxylase symporter family transporter [Rectinema sp.]HPN92035.1 cation:dicarboxylase symporter family transporter [Rectinema sp.]HPW01864.1 cation:dicarboxylase symporter family transporter [Rectinema sp.]
MLPKMKLWHKYALGIAMGAILYLVLPPSMIHGTPMISFLSELALKIGGYALILTLTVGIPISVFRLSEAHRFTKIVSQSLLLSVVSLVVAAGIGIAVVLVFKPVPLPLVSQSGTVQTLDPLELILAIFPTSIFDVFSVSAKWFLPIGLFALFFGLALSHDPVMSRPILPVLDVISRASYLINFFISEILGILLIPISLYLFLNLRNTGIPSEYRSVLLFVLILTVFLIFVLFPLVYRILGGKSNPYILLYAMSGPLLTAAASGSIFISSATALRHVSESLGIKRDTNAVVFPLVLVGGRVGSVIIVACSFIAMFLSYSRNNPTAGQIILLLALLPLSVTVGASALRSDIIVMLSLVCVLFGQGFQNGASLLVPIALPLSICATILDTAWLMFSLSIIAELNGQRSVKKARNFI